MPFELKHIDSNQVLHDSDVSNNSLNDPGLIETVDKLDLPFATAVLTHWRFDGIHMIHTDWKYQNTHTNMAFRSDLDIVQLHFNLKGRVSAHSDLFEKQVQFEQNQHNMLYGNGNSGTMTHEQLTSSQFIVQFARDNFFETD